MAHCKTDKTVQMVQSSHNGYNMKSTVQILLLIEYIIFNASFKQAETECLHIMWEVIPYFWALIVKSALPGTCSTEGSMQPTILACKMRMDIHIYLKAK